MPGFGQKKQHAPAPPAKPRAIYTRLSGGLGMVEFVEAPVPPPRKPTRAPVLPLGKIDHVQLPGARVAALAAANAGTGLIGATDLSAQLEDITGLALARARDILENPLDADSDYYPEELRAVTSTIKTALLTQTRVDENKLRRRELDVMPQLMKIIEEEEKRLGLAPTAAQI